MTQFRKGSNADRPCATRDRGGLGFRQRQPLLASLHRTVWREPLRHAAAGLSDWHSARPVRTSASPVVQQVAIRLSLDIKGRVMRRAVRGDKMIEDAALQDWFCREVLPLEGSLTQFIQRNWRVAADVSDLRHDIYERAIGAARRELPTNTRAYIFSIARNLLINQAKRARVVSFDLIADVEAFERDIDLERAERHLSARDELRHVQIGLDKLPPGAREIICLRKIDGLSVAETAEYLGIGKDAVNHQLMRGMKALADHMMGGAGKIVRPRPRRGSQKGDHV